MYKSFFGLKENPFSVNPDPRFFYLTSQVEETLTGCMESKPVKGFITLTGEVGTGKATLSTGCSTVCTPARPAGRSHVRSVPIQASRS